MQNTRLCRAVAVMALLAASVAAHAEEGAEYPAFRNPFSMPLRAREKPDFHPGPVNNDLTELQETRYTQKDNIVLPLAVSPVAAVTVSQTDDPVAGVSPSLVSGAAAVSVSPEALATAQPVPAVPDSDTPLKIDFLPGY